MIVHQLMSYQTLVLDWFWWCLMCLPARDLWKKSRWSTWSGDWLVSMLIKCLALISLKAFEGQHTHTQTLESHKILHWRNFHWPFKPFIPDSLKKLKLQHLLCRWQPDWNSHTSHMNSTMRAGLQHGLHRSVGRVCVTEVQWECCGRLALCYCMQITESDSTRLVFCSKSNYNIQYHYTSIVNTITHTHNI